MGAKTRVQRTVGDGTPMDWEAFYNSFRQPDFIPGYEIQNRLGGGAFGEVYKARKHSIGKAYAIKFLKLDDETQREVIERELEQVRHFASIDHPNLVSIEDMGSVAGIPYLVMGYAGEDTLARRLRQGGLDRRQALVYFVQACRGVLALHDRRLVHLDLKPSNIFIKGDIARVGDYGLAKLMSDGRLTLSFGRGTPYYMAPEILHNRADQRADLYSLGVILYECQAGRVPFDTPSPGGLVLRQEDLPPAFPPDFPVDLRPVVERCLRLDPDRRYAGVEELLADLGQAARQGDSIVLAPAAAGADRPGPGGGAWAGDVPPAPSANGSQGATGTRDRSAAEELARGAVGVARGMWEGIRSATPVGAPPGGTPAGGAEGAFRRVGTAAPPGSPAPPPAGSAVSAVSGPGPPPDARSPATIPVPPRAAGGALGAVAAALVLAVEVPLTMLGALAAVFWRGLGPAAGRAVGVGGALFWRVTRLLLFLIALAFLGAMLMFLALLVLGADLP